MLEQYRVEDINFWSYTHAWASHGDNKPCPNSLPLIHSCLYDRQAAVY